MLNQLKMFFKLRLSIIIILKKRFNVICKIHKLMTSQVAKDILPFASKHLLIQKPKLQIICNKLQPLSLVVLSHLTKKILHKSTKIQQPKDHL